MNTLREAAMFSLASGTHDRKKPEERKTELLDIAIRLFLQKGYEDTSVKDIFTEANGSFGMFYHHFKSKDEIFAEAMDKFTRQYTQQFSDILLDEAVPFDKRYGAAINHYIGFLKAHDKIRGHNCEGADVSIFKVLNLKMISESVRPIQLFIEEGSEKGILQVEDSHQAAVFIAYGIWGNICEEADRICSNENAPSVLSKLPSLFAKITGADEALFQLSNI